MTFQKEAKDKISGSLYRVHIDYIYQYDLYQKTTSKYEDSEFDLKMVATGLMVYFFFILSTISPYTTGLRALFNHSNCTSTVPTDK